ncbi:tetratricopeptide repeat protein [Winogradskyella sp. MH6]|uniref:tetratricopeptide repeat protein n=1 Tax=Winogradskyella sp. MH6 TaxID=2929510 RepID=UPI001FB2F891|nr:hypothetical protein [Winogradskyella sp. MH6]
MGLTIADSYYLKAKGAMSGWFSDWNEACETLNYALSYDENHCPSLCLLGKIYAEYMYDFDKAFDCYDKVISINPDFKEVYPAYIMYLIWADENERAEKLIDFAFKIKGVDVARLNWLSSYINETKGKYKKSLKDLKAAKKVIYNDYFFDFMLDEEKRIKKKIALDKPKKKKTSKKKKKDKQKKKNK